MHKIICISALVFFAFITACKSPEPAKDNDVHTEGISTGIKYAKRFSVVNYGAYDVLYLFGNRANHDTTSIFVITPDTVKKMPAVKHAVWIKGSCKRIASLSSIYSAMFCELNSADRIVAIDNIDYVNDPQIIAKFKKGELKELARAPQIDLEKTIALNPDIIFTFGMGDWEKDLDEKLRRTGIPVAISIDHLEETPLARAEWIKFFALFVNKKMEADSIFNEVEQSYLRLKTMADSMNERPTVFSEIKYSDAWYLPGGKSYVATLFNDAAANYLWKDDAQAGSLPLSFEQVYARAKDADYWINLSTVKTKKELLGYEPRYTEFKAFKTGNLFNNTKHTNSFGYSNYWETGMIHPERILSDLIGIFHPLKREEFFYYEQLK